MARLPSREMACPLAASKSQVGRIVATHDHKNPSGKTRLIRASQTMKDIKRIPARQQPSNSGQTSWPLRGCAQSAHADPAGRAAGRSNWLPPATRTDLERRVEAVWRRPASASSESSWPEQASRDQELRETARVDFFSIAADGFLDLVEDKVVFAGLAGGDDVEAQVCAQVIRPISKLG